MMMNGMNVGENEWWKEQKRNERLEKKWNKNEISKEIKKTLPFPVLKKDLKEKKEKIES